MTLHITPQLHFQLKIYAAQHKINIQDLAEKIIIEYLEKQEEKQCKK